VERDTEVTESLPNRPMAVKPELSFRVVPSPYVALMKLPKIVRGAGVMLAVAGSPSLTRAHKLHVFECCREYFAVPSRKQIAAVAAHWHSQARGQIYIELL
jgi:hypothetical protein